MTVSSRTRNKTELTGFLDTNQKKMLIFTRKRGNIVFGYVPFDGEARDAYKTENRHDSGCFDGIRSFCGM